MRSWKIIILLMMFCFAAELSALEINSISDRVPARLQCIDVDGKGICPDSIAIEVLNPNTGATILSAWVDSTDGWVTRKISSNNSDTALFINPTMDDIDAGAALDEFFVSYGAYDSSEQDYVWAHIYVQVNRKLTLAASQTFNTSGSVGSVAGNVTGNVNGNVGGSVNSITMPVTVGDANTGAFTSGDFASAFYQAIYDKFIDGTNENAFKGLLGDTTLTISRRLRWLSLYTGCEPGTVTHLKPFGASPKTLQETVGENYKVNFHLNPVNTEVVDSIDIDTIP